MWNHIININLSELLRKKTKESKINEHKKNFKNGQFTFSFFYLIMFLQDFLKS